MRSKQYYAAIDLGSNSFHMLVVRVVAGGVQVVSKIKRKVRLAAGLQPDGTLSTEAQQRALDCLRIFADRVQDIHPDHIRAVGTATLRKVRHDQSFLTAAETALGHPIHVITGRQEAATIYQGIAHTTACSGHTLVIDIGGASTELILGEGFVPEVLHSLDMGCVTTYCTYFADGAITHENTKHAIDAARDCIQPVAGDFSEQQWSLVLGASGTFKALDDIASAEGINDGFNADWLHQLLQRAIACGHHDQLDIKGLAANRRSVFVSGLCILIAVCDTLGIDRLQATNGALREGIIYGMLDELQHEDVQLRTLESVVATYHLDLEQAQRVFSMATTLLHQVQASWSFPTQSWALIRAVSYLHELGLSLAYKQASTHTTYMLRHLDLPGFDAHMRDTIIRLLNATAGIIDDDYQAREIDASLEMRHLSRILRLAIICCQRRNDHSLVDYQLHADGDALVLAAPNHFLEQNPFLRSLLDEEIAQLQAPETLQLASVSESRADAPPPA
ncbi:guanosine-5'-triphosphate,3'-diphosphate pyrophosphatase [Aliidiomarina sp. Khilg15.8]